jgi:hypothetical protein
MRIIILFFICIFFSSPVFCNPAITCHCFKDRSYNADDPGKIDPYLLATTQNSLMACVFDIPKKDIVQAKMSGTSGDDLWIAHYCASKSGVDPKKLMAAKKDAGSWKTALKREGVEFSKLGDKFSGLVSAGALEESLSSEIVDYMLEKRLGAGPDVLKHLRAKGASSKEVILSTIFSLRSGHRSDEFYRTVTSGQMTWGNHMHALGLQPKDMITEIKKLLK